MVKMKMVRRKLANIGPSWRAVKMLWREEDSFKIQTVCGALALLVAYLLDFSRMEWTVLFLTIGAVLAIEALNTALEELCDHITLEQHPQIGKVKDLGSAASGLIGSAALLIGVTLFLPHLL